LSDLWDQEFPTQRQTKEPYGARQMETHHHIIEWALANAVSGEKFNWALLPSLRRRHPENPE
jgi:hypothetical protein